MLEVVLEKLKHCKFKQLEHHFELEDLYNEILFDSRHLSEEQIEQRQKLLDYKVNQRKNLYIYPAKVNV